MAGLSMVDTGGLAAKETATWKASREADRSTSSTTRLVVMAAAAAGISRATRVVGWLAGGVDVDTTQRGASRSVLGILSFVVVSAIVVSQKMRYEADRGSTSCGTGIKTKETTARARLNLGATKALFVFQGIPGLPAYYVPCISTYFGMP